MREIEVKKRYLRSIRLCHKRGLNMRKMEKTIEILRQGKSLPVRCRPHKLVGNYAGMWECHIEPDWLLIYAIDDDRLTLIDTGTHSDLFA